jgi:hypothetical protein
MNIVVRGSKKRSRKMKLEKSKKVVTGGAVEDNRPAYESPKIVTYTSEQILEQIGPAMACVSSPTCSMGPG